MADEPKNSPIIRILLIIIIGTIAFGLLFNMLTGGGNMDHMGGMNNMGYGASIDTFLGGLLILLVKLLMIVLVIAVIIGVGVWVKNTFFKNASTNQLMKSINNDPILKTVLVITVAVIGVVLLLAILGSFTGTSLGSGLHGGMIGGFSSTLSIAGLLNLLIKALSFVLVVSLILALVAYIKKQADQGAFNFMKSNAQETPGGTNTSKNTEPGDNTNNP